MPAFATAPSTRLPPTMRRITATKKGVEYNSALSGISGFETAFALCMDALVHAHHMTMEEFVQVACTNPAKILGKNCGKTRSGPRRDFIIADIAKEWTVDRREFVSKGQNTPFDGRTVHGRVLETYVGGKRIYKYEIKKRRQGG